MCVASGIEEASIQVMHLNYCVCLFSARAASGIEEASIQVIRLNYCVFVLIVFITVLLKSPCLSPSLSQGDRQGDRQLEG